MLPTTLGSISLFVSTSLIGLATYYDVKDNMDIPVYLLYFFFVVCIVNGFSDLLNGFFGVALFLYYYILHRFFNNGEAEAWMFGGVGFLLGVYSLPVVALAHIIALPTVLLKKKEIAFTPYILLSFGLVCLWLLLF